MFQHKETPLFEKIMVLLPIIYLLIFSILKIFNGRFFGKITGQKSYKSEALIDTDLTLSLRQLETLCRASHRKKQRFYFVLSLVYIIFATNNLHLL